MGPHPFVSVVDDDYDVRLALGGMLRSVGYDVECFESAEAFLEAAESSNSDCIVSDVQMGGMSGLDMARELRARGIGAPLILISAFTTDAVRAQAARQGAHCVLEKPFDPEVLLEQVEACTGRPAPHA